SLRDSVLRVSGRRSISVNKNRIIRQIESQTTAGGEVFAGVVKGRRAARKLDLVLLRPILGVIARAAPRLADDHHVPARDGALDLGFALYRGGRKIDVQSVGRERCPLTLHGHISTITPFTPVVEIFQTVGANDHRTNSTPPRNFSFQTRGERAGRQVRGHDPRRGGDAAVALTTRQRPGCEDSPT